MSGYFGAPNDFRNYLMHYGVKGMKWGRRKSYTDYELTKVRPSRRLDKKRDGYSPDHDAKAAADGDYRIARAQYMAKTGKERNDKIGSNSARDARDRMQSQYSAKDGRIRSDKDDSFSRQKHDARDKSRLGKLGEHKNSVQMFAGSHRQAIQSLLRQESARQEIDRNVNRKRKRDMNPRHQRKRNNS